jgi:hypothetical protein
VPERIPLFTRLVDLEWFVEDKFGFSVPPDQPLGRAIALNANPVPPPPTSGPEEQTYLIRARVCTSRPLANCSTLEH